MLGLVFALTLAAGAAPAKKARAPERPAPPVDQAKIDAAIEKAAEFVRAKVREGIGTYKASKGEMTMDEIALYALIHAGVNRGDPDLIKLVQTMRDRELHWTYPSAIRMMAFELYDKDKLRADLVRGAMYLVDNQGKNGQWGYGKPVDLPPLPKVTFTPSPAPPVYTGGGPQNTSGVPAGPTSGSGGTATASKKSGGTQARVRIPLNRRDFGTPNDNSNSQYAILGLAACSAAGVMLPPDCLPLVEKWWTDQQNDDGGWDYAEPAKTGKSYGSMTAGGVSSTAICLRAQNRDPLDDLRVQRGLEWLGKNLGFDANPCTEDNWLKNQQNFYWIYSIERAGSMAGTEWFGDHAWYAEGAKWLLEKQQPDGSWKNNGPYMPEVMNTSWAILFLRRATKHIATSVVYTK